MKGSRNPRKQKFAKLRGLLRFMGVTYADLAEAYNESHPNKQRYANWFSLLLCGRAEWRLSDMYWLLDLLDVPHTQLHEYFPPNGDEEGV